MSISWLTQSHNLVDIVHGVIPYNGLEAQIIENPIFARLQRIYQSSLAYLTYPSGKVHRFEHSLGVMHLAGNFFYHSVCNSHYDSIKRLFDEARSIILQEKKKNDSDLVKEDSRLISDIKAEKNMLLLSDSFDKIAYIDNTLYRNYTPADVEMIDREIYYIIFESIRLVGLLHDVGHLPYSHITEFALKRLYRECTVNENGSALSKNFIDIMSGYCKEDGKDKQIHEEIGYHLVEKIFDTIVKSLNKGDNKEKFFIMCVIFFTKQILNSSPESNDLYSDLHRIVDGVIDCDRMDYCCRDLYCSGVSKEFPRYERIFNTVQILYKQPDCLDNKDLPKENRERCCFAYSSKALGQIEMLIQRRWEDFTTINYHHKVHKHELLLELVIAELGKKHVLNIGEEEDLNGKLPLEISSIWKCIKTVEADGAVEILISQLDDEWLNTLLKKEFFNEYGVSYEERRNNHNIVNWNRMDELITGQKHYCSLFKRTGGFKRFDDCFKEACVNKNAFTKNIKSEEIYPEYYFGKLLKKEIKSKKSISSALYYNKVKKSLEDWSHTDEAKTEYNIIDCIIDENDFSLGIKASDMESIYIVSSRPNNPPLPLKGRSAVFDNLKQQKALFPPFHIFYLPKYDQEHEEYFEVDAQKLQVKIAQIMADCMENVFESRKRRKKGDKR